MNVGIVGIGLIGGSLAKVYKSKGHTVYGFDKDDSIREYAQLSGVVDGELNEKTIKDCDAIFIAINPHDTVAYLKNVAPTISKDTIVFDCCGIKRYICEQCFPLAKKYGFTFVGGHPMAGSHKMGFANSSAELFIDAPMVLVPPFYDNPVLIGRIDEILKPVGFGHFAVTTAEKHDEIIAFSSQMAHVISNAFIKSPTAHEHKGFSAGSYLDLTRVARLDADMWAKLCMENSDFLIKEIDAFINAMTSYRNALASKDEVELKKLFEEGSRLKKELDS